MVGVPQLAVACPQIAVCIQAMPAIGLMMKDIIPCHYCSDTPNGMPQWVGFVVIVLTLQFLDKTCQGCCVFVSIGLHAIPISGKHILWYIQLAIAHNANGPVADWHRRPYGTHGGCGQFQCLDHLIDTGMMHGPIRNARHCVCHKDTTKLTPMTLP